MRLHIATLTDDRMTMPNLCIDDTLMRPSCREFIH